ncbi:hypothetical protein [Chroococcidiopsis sp.]|uniref:hypothetical protein n=1 Tax=Chroococcidiopsis sp. TaxID=3088168 RepID=UPI003F38846C
MNAYPASNSKPEKNGEIESARSRVSQISQKQHQLNLYRLLLRNLGKPAMLL